MRRLAALALAATLAAGGCNEPTVAVRGPALAARVESGVLLLENLTDERLYYTAIDERSLALIDLHYCTADPEVCADRRIEPHATKRVPAGQVIGWEAGTDVIVVHHWHVRVREGGGNQAYSYDPLAIVVR